MNQYTVNEFNKEEKDRASPGKLDLDRVNHLSKNLCATPTALIVSLIYLERLRAKNQSFLTSVSSADLFLVTLMLASKFLHDDGEEDEVYNEEWAEAGFLRG